MLSPQEAESKVFTKASFGGGYHMGQVDAFLDELIGDYAALYKENAALKSKMKVLVEKLEEYRATEDAMRRTLLSAQQMADNMLKEAADKKNDAIALAESETRTRVDEIRRELANEEMRLLAARNATASYVEKLQALYEHEISYMAKLSELTVLPVTSVTEQIQAQESEAKVSELVAAAHSAATTATEGPKPEGNPREEPEVLADTQPEKPAEPEAEKKPAFSAEDSDTMVFDRLEFGRDYQFE